MEENNHVAYETFVHDIYQVLSKAGGLVVVKASHDSTSEPGAVATGQRLSFGDMYLGNSLFFKLSSLAGRYRSRF